MQGAVRKAVVTFGQRGGFVVECPDRGRSPFPVGSPLELAELFEELELPLEEEEPEFDLDEKSLGIVRGDSLPDMADVQERMRAASKAALAGNGDQGAGSGEEWPAAPAVVRTPVADDGTEYPPVRQEGPNHFVIECPNHGEKRMERQGTNWRCTGQTNKQQCGVVIPRSVIGRQVAG